MSHRIIVEFPDRETANKFCAELSDGFGESECEFSAWRQLPGTDGTKREHFERATGSAPEGTTVCFCRSVGRLETEDDGGEL